MLEIALKARQIFEYLLAIKESSTPVERDMSKYSPIWWEEDIPYMDGCYLYGSGDNPNAWLEVHKQEISPPPAPPQILHEWITGDLKNPDKKPSYSLTISKGDNDIAFEESKDRVLSWSKWIDAWEKWAAVMAPKMKIQKLYSDFFSLYQRFQREEEIIELIWGHGLFTWNTNGQRISRHLFVTRMGLFFIAEKGAFEIIPTDKGTWVEIDMLNELEIPNIERLVNSIRIWQEEGIDPLDPGIIESLSSEIVNTISSEGTVNFDISKRSNATTTNIPIVYNTPALFIRDKTVRQWQAELNNIITAIDEGHPIPPLITALTVDEELNSILPPEFVESTLEEWKSVGEEIFFPLVSNNEQKEIITRLSRSFGVSVQGPPGTGKSHTIANLICHLLAHGKRVLVTSHTERALRVLADKIPENVRNLCVSVTGGDSSSIKEIEASIRAISDNLSLNVEELNDNLAQYKADLSNIRNEIAKLRHTLRQAATKENTKIPFEGSEKLPWQIAEWLNNNEEHSWIPDSINYESNQPSDETITRLFYLAGTLKRADLDAIDTYRPPLDKIPTLQSFKHLIQSWTKENEALNTCREAMAGWRNTVEIHPEIDSLIQHIDDSLASISLFSEPWSKNILDDISKGGIHKEHWSSLVNDCRPEIEDISQINRLLAPYYIMFPSGVSLSQLREDLEKLHQHLSDNKSINWMFINLTGRKLKYLIDEVAINGAKIKDVDQVGLLLKNIERDMKQQVLINRWNSYMSDIDGEVFRYDQQRLIPLLDSHLNVIQIALDWEEKTVSPISPILKGLGIDQTANLTSPEWFMRLREGLKAVYQEKCFNEIDNQITTLRTFLERGLSSPNAHPCWSQLLKALENRDDGLWESILNELNRLSSIESQRNELEGIRVEVAKLVPLWVSQIINSAGNGEPLDVPVDWKTAWKWSQANSWYTKFKTKTDVESLINTINHKQKQEARLIEHIVATSAWLHQIKNTTEPQKRSLHAWVQIIKRIGKGTGKYAEKHRQDAKREMEKCQDAIPVWIMPLHRVIENLKITNKPFDVVIVDESSQSDIFSLVAFFRAKKAIVVGDDKQISPESVGIDQSKINDLIRRYLPGIPQKEGLDLQTSLYDIGLRIFPGNLMLKEHFRCVPEIIHFSNDNFYGGQIEPLRTPKVSEILDPPICTVRVPEGRREENTAAINHPEAEALVEQIALCCKDPKYEGRTMGVISLQGYEQARVILELLREKIGDQEINARHIICGDAYSFQGDERDVMFLSMVAAPNMRIGALTKLTDEKRFNVAASRAKDQVWLFHSVDISDLNSNCMRSRLLGYYLDPGRSVRETESFDDLFESKFERDVFKLISARGYAVRPQIKVGRYNKRIDMVIDGLRNRLAVECDGDQWHGPDRWEQDMERQQLLERIGWVFWRVTGSSFYRDPEKAMRSLWIKLDEMGIEPAASKIASLANHDAKDIIIKTDKPSKRKGASTTYTDHPNDEKVHNNQPALFSTDSSITTDIIEILEKRGLSIIDKRQKGGPIWVVGGSEFSSIFEDIEKSGFKFKFSQKGGKATKHKPGWYLT
ncbi:MAG: AAA domain-containing protein [Syntrophomonas sp.]